MQTVPFLLVGLGNLGRRFCEILLDKAPLLRQSYQLDLSLVGAADSRGAAYAPGTGLDLAEVVRIKRSGGTIAEVSGVGRCGWSAADLIAAAEAELLLEVSPVNLSLEAEPGLTCIRTALRRGMHVVTANKGPLVVAYQELRDLAAAHGAQFRFDGTVAGGLPAIGIGQRDLRGATIHSLEAVPNLVTGYIMDLLTEGKGWDDALADAWRQGVLEGDGYWDIEGWDAAAKLVILANSVLGVPAQLDDVARTGIDSLDVVTLSTARNKGYLYRLLARADLLSDGGYDLSVSPVPLPMDHPLGRLGPKQMGVVYHTDIYGTIVAIIDEPNPIPSAASLLRDLLIIYRDSGN